MTDLGEIIVVAGTQDVQSFEDALIAALPPIYEKQDLNTNLRKLYNSLAQELVKADIILESVGNNNYISISIADEIQIRSVLSSDRLKNENAFELNSVRFTPSGSRIHQNMNLIEGINTVQLYFLPEDIDFIIFDANDPNQIPLAFLTFYDENTNSITVQANKSGVFTVTYKDTGDVVRLKENITVPVGLFSLGWDLDGFGFLGYDE